MSDRAVVASFVVGTLLVLLFVWAATPTCAPDEVYARGVFTLVCVKGH